MGLSVAGSARSRTRTTASGPRWGAAVVVAAALGYAWLGAGTRSFTWPAMVLTTLGGLAILIPAWLRERRGHPPARVRASRRGLVAWTVWVAAVTGWELWALSMHPRSTHPTISSLLDSVVDTQPGRFVALLAWLGFGWWLARR